MAVVDNNNIEWLKNNCMLFKETSHASEVLSGLDELRRNEEFCDVYLRAGGTKYAAHRCVLSSACHYFRTMFSSGLVESKSKEIEIHGIDGEAFVDVVDYLYKGVVRINADNVEMLMMAANMMQLPKLMEACSTYLQAQMDYSNCLGFHRFAKLHDCPSLLGACQSFIIQSFSKLVPTEEYGNLTLKELVDLISIEDLRVSSENEVLEGVLKWMFYQYDSRLPFSYYAFERVKLCTIPEEIIRTAVKHAFINFSLPSNNLPDQDTLLKKLLHLRSDQMEVGNILPRKGCERFIYVIGGYRSPANVNWYNGDCLTSIEKVNLSNMSLQSYSIQSLPVPRRCHAVAAIHGCLYVFGGEDDIFIMDSIHCFDPALNRWKRAGSLPIPRCGMSAVPFRNKVFLMGGCVGSDVTSSIDVYDPVDFTVKNIGYLSVGRSFFGCTVKDDKIFVAGGYDTYNLPIANVDEIDPYSLKSSGLCENYDNAVSIKRLAPMIYTRASFAMVTVDDTIYAFGGQIGSIEPMTNRQGPISNFVELYCAKSDTWKILKTGHPFKMLSNFSCVVHDNNIYIVGGKDENSNSVSAIWCLNRDNTWTRTINLTLDRCNHAAVVF